MSAVASETYTSTCAPVQYAAVRAFDGGPEIDAYLGVARRVLEALGRLLAQRLREAGATVTPPEGGFYLFPDFSAHADRLRARGIETSEQLCDRLLEDTGVAILPGSCFGVPTERLTARLAYVDFDGAAALEAAESRAPGSPMDEPFLRSFASRTLDAVDLLCEWLGLDVRVPAIKLPAAPSPVRQ
jgi:aspartate aminotransferase